MAPGDVIVTMDADCTYPGEEVPGLVRKLIDEDLQWITCDRLKRAEEGSMSGLHGFGNWALSFTARLLFLYGIHDSQSGMWVFWKRIMEETGKDLGEINLKTLTLSRVFELELQNYEQEVTAICVEAKEEAKNEENIQKIDQAWK